MLVRGGEGRSFTSFDKSFRISLRPAGTEIVLVFCFVTRDEEGEEGEDCRLVSLDLLLIFRPRFSSDLQYNFCLPAVTCLPGTLRLSLFSL